MKTALALIATLALTLTACGPGKLVSSLPTVGGSSGQGTVPTAPPRGTLPPIATMAPLVTPPKSTPMASAGAATSASPRGTPGSSTGGQTSTVQLVAQNLSFNRKTITVPPGAHVVVQFTNMDSVQHNFAVYKTSAAKDKIFSGQIVTGPNKTVTYSFTAPSQPGTYFFRCDVHPTLMNGQFIVK